MSFDTNGDYNKTNWKSGDKITADKLNKIEEALETINNKINESDDSEEVDLSGYATKEELNNKANKEHTHEQYLTEHQSLEDYATKDELFSKNYNDLTNKPTIPTIEGLATENYVNSKIEEIDVTNQLEEYAKKEEIPTKISQLTNDKNYLTEIPSEYITEDELNDKNYATEAYVQNKIAEAQLEGEGVDLSGYVTKEELSSKADKKHTHNQYLTEHQDISNLATKDELFSKNYNDLTNKPTIPTKTSQLTNDSDFLTSIPSEYITEDELNDKNYLTEHIDISGKVDKEEGKSLILDTEIQRLSTLKNYNDEEVKELIEDKADKKHTHNQYLTEHQDISNLATKDELNNKVDKVNGKGLSTNDYTTEEKNKLNGIEENANNYIHPSTHNANIITQDSTHRFVSDEEKNNWNNKSNFSGSYNDLTNKPTIPTVTNDLTNALKTNYDVAYNHSQTTHAPSNAQKNSDITKSEIEAKLTGNVTSHTHNQYLTEHQDISGKADKSELRKYNAFGTCDTAAETVEKAIVIDDPNWTLEAGSLIMVRFSVSNSASNVTLNVNNTGAYGIRTTGTGAYTGNSTTFCGIADRTLTYIFDGTYWQWISVGGYPGSTTNVSLGQGYTTCSTATSTKAKVASLSSYTLSTGGIVAVKFTNDVPASATLNINSKGAKNIYHKGVAITDGVIKAGDTATFIYSTHYHLISIDRDETFSGDYNDLTNKPAIPTKTSELTNDSNFLTSVPNKYELPDYYYENNYIIGKILKIQEFMDEAGADGLVFIDFSDSHMELGNEGKNGGNSGKIIRKIKEDCKIERVLYNGDATSNSPQETEALCLETMNSFDEMVSPVGELFFMLGNHDGAYGLPVDGVTYPYNITRQKRFNRLQQRNRQGIIKVFGEDGTYFYVDDPCQRHRFIIMNTSDKPYATNDNGTMVTECNTMKGFAVRQPQIDFIINALKTVPEGWTVTSHAHIVFNNSFIATDAYIRNLFKAYKNKSTYSVSYDGVYGGAPVAQYTNLADTKSPDWLSNNRLNSSGVGSSVTGCVATNFIPVAKNDVIRIQGIDLTAYNTAVYNESKAVQGSQLLTNYSSSAYLSDIVANKEGGQCKIASDGIKYIRFSGTPVTTVEDIIITKNEEIIETPGTAWDALKINVDFTESKGDYIAHFCGHAHNDYHYSSSDYLINMISVACDGRVSNNSYMSNETYQKRALGTIYEQVIDVKIINRTTRTIHIVRIGAGENRTIPY